MEIFLQIYLVWILVNFGEIGFGKFVPLALSFILI